LLNANYQLSLFLCLIGLVGAPACGDVMKLQVEVDENGKIVDAKFKTFGCGSAIGKLYFLF
jgi:NifU-like protein involved in Fe-S cluster formation